LVSGFCRLCVSLLARDTSLASPPGRGSIPAKAPTLTAQMFERDDLSAMLSAADSLPDVVPLLEADDALTVEPPLILIADDEELIREVLSESLERWGYRCHTVENAAAALDYVRGGEGVALLVSDIMMPGGMTGIELGTVVHLEFPNVPVILMTGFVTAAERARWTGDTILQKPFRLNDLRKAIVSALGEKLNEPA